MSKKGKHTSSDMCLLPMKSRYNLRKVSIEVFDSCPLCKAARIIQDNQHKMNSLILNCLRCQAGILATPPKEQHKTHGCALYAPSCHWHMDQTNPRNIIWRSKRIITLHNFASFQAFGIESKKLAHPQIWEIQCFCLLLSLCCCGFVLSL